MRGAGQPPDAECRSEGNGDRSGGSCREHARVSGLLSVSRRSQGESYVPLTPTIGARSTLVK